MSSLKTPKSIGGKSAIIISHSNAILDKLAPQVCKAWDLLLGEFGSVSLFNLSLCIEVSSIHKEEEPIGSASINTQFNLNEAI